MRATEFTHKQDVVEARYDYSLKDYQTVPYDSSKSGEWHQKTKGDLNPNIGPQEGKYLNLMLKKMKPVTAIEPNQDDVRKLFQPYIDNGTLSLALVNSYGRWYVTLPGEEWRAKKLESIWQKMAVVAKQPGGLQSPTFKLLNAKIGRLLGIPKESVRYYLNNLPGSTPKSEGELDEMALATYKTMGDFSKQGPFTGADKKLVPHPKNIEKATRFFEQTPFDFRLFFSHLKGTGRYSEFGPMSHEQIRQVFGQDAEEIINGSEDAITVVYVGNRGAEKVMLTPWMMAHRFGHAINAGVRNQNWHTWKEAEKYFFQTVNSFLEEHYGKTKPQWQIRPTSEFNRNLRPEYNALFNAMGTQRSSTTGQIRRPYEFLYELFAQYLGTGKVTLNPLPTNLTYGRKAWGNPTKYMNIKPEYRDEGERKQAADSLAYTMELLFNDVLSSSVGQIFVM